MVGTRIPDCIVVHKKGLFWGSGGLELKKDPPVRYIFVWYSGAHTVVKLARHISTMLFYTFSFLLHVFLKILWPIAVHSAKFAITLTLVVFEIAVVGVQILAICLGKTTEIVILDIFNTSSLRIAQRI